MGLKRSKQNELRSKFGGSNTVPLVAFKVDLFYLSWIKQPADSSRCKVFEQKTSDKDYILVISNSWHSNGGKFQNHWVDFYPDGHSCIIKQPIRGV